MKRSLVLGLALAMPSGVLAFDAAHADDVTPKPKPPQDCKVLVDPYKNYACLDKYLGDNPVERFFNYYRLEWGHDAAPTDPNAPANFRPGWKQSFPQSTPPYPFTEWPYGGSQNIGETLPNAVDSPLMVAIANTAAGKALNDAHIQIYGWVDPGANFSTNTVKPSGNSPAAYDFIPNSVQLDQAVIYVERVPNEVQNDHIDWGFRISAIYGADERYTEGLGYWSYQFLNHNDLMGYDMPMMYGEVYVPWLQGLNLRFGRYISIPDIEAQLAPNNYMYTHSLTYTWDNYTNTGLQATLAVTKNWFLQLGVSIGTEAIPGHWGQTIFNPFPNQIYPGLTMDKDPGAIPSIAAGIRYQTDSGNDNIYVVADGINSGIWGFNNLQWLGMTWYHKFSDDWHISVESYWIHLNDVLNFADPAHIIANSGYPFYPGIMPFNAPGFAVCSDPQAVTCRANSYTILAYLNYRINGLNNLSFRGEFFDDPQGQRTGVATRYVEMGIGLQHWLSPQIEFRPEVSFYASLDAPAFNGNPAAGIAPNKYNALIAASDVIIHF